MTYFAPPRRIETAVFTRLPDRFRRPRRTAWADANQGGREIDSFLEGPSFDRQGRLYVTDIPYGRVFRVSPEGAWEQVAEYDGWPNGLKIHRDGRILITDYKRGIMLLDPSSGSVTRRSRSAAEEPSEAATSSYSGGACSTAARTPTGTARLILSGNMMFTFCSPA